MVDRHCTVLLLLLLLKMLSDLNFLHLILTYKTTKVSDFASPLPVPLSQFPSPDVIGDRGNRTDVRFGTLLVSGRVSHTMRI